MVLHLKFRQGLACIGLFLFLSGCLIDPNQVMKNLFQEKELLTDWRLGAPHLYYSPSGYELLLGLNYGKQFRFYLLDKNGHAEKQVFPEKNSDKRLLNMAQVEWLPNGQAFSFITQDTSQTKYSLYRVPINPIREDLLGAREIITEEKRLILRYAWAADSQQLAILFQQAPESGQAIPQPNRLYLEFKGSDSELLLKPIEFDGEVKDLRWVSPEEVVISSKTEAPAFRLEEKPLTPPNFELYRIHSKSGMITNLTQSPGDDLTFRLTEGNQRLVVFAEQEQKFNLYKLGLKDKKTEVISNYNSVSSSTRDCLKTAYPLLPLPFDGRIVFFPLKLSSLSTPEQTTDLCHSLFFINFPYFDLTQSHIDLTGLTPTGLSQFGNTLALIRMVSTGKYITVPGSRLGQDSKRYLGPDHLILSFVNPAGNFGESESPTRIIDFPQGEPRFSAALF